MKTYFFDMDGTFVDLYGVDNWLDDLINEKTRPYDEAKPLVNLAAPCKPRKTCKGYEQSKKKWK